MSRILGILLDNAFEEAVKTESKNVILSIIPLKTQIIYVIKNSCNTVPDISKIFLNNYSTKGENHGRGLSIVQNICNNYSNVFFNVKKSDQYKLSDFCFENLTLRAKKGKVDQSIIDSFTMNNVKINQ